MLSISICGVGRVGGALAFALEKAGLSVDQLIVRERAHHDVERVPELGSKVVTWDAVEASEPDVVVIATRDHEIENAARSLAEHGVAPKVVLHTSGSLSGDVLVGIFGDDAAVGSMHPLISISDPHSGAGYFSGAYFCIDGDDVARRRAEEIAHGLGARIFSVPAEYRPLYHAAAVTACGHLVALADVALEMFEKCGFAKNEAQEILLPLVSSTVGNLARVTPERALTGPFARGDIDTFKRHLRALNAEVSAEAVDIYLKLGLRSVEMVMRDSGPDGDAQGLGRAISMAKENVEC